MKEHLTRDEMRGINGGVEAPNDCLVLTTCNFNSQCPNSYCDRCIPSPFGDEAGYCAT